MYQPPNLVCARLSCGRTSLMQTTNAGIAQKDGERIVNGIVQ